MLKNGNARSDFESSVGFAGQDSISMAKWPYDGSENH